MATKKHLIIGAGPAALSALGAIRQISPHDEVKLVTREDFLPYSPAALSYLISGELEESQLWMRDDSYFKSMKSSLIRGKEINQVVPDKKEVAYRDGSSESYDTLLIASGAEPVKPPVQGMARVALDFRTLTDCRSLLRRLKGRKNVAILGSGLVGMKIALALLGRGCRVSIIEKEPGILPLNFNEESEVYIREIFAERGARFFTGKEAKSVKRKDGGVMISLSDGNTIDADILVNAAGVKGRVSFLRGNGVDFASGVLVDSRMRTSAEAVYAAGDVAEAQDFFSGKPRMNANISGAVRQGRVAGANMAGKKAEYEGGIPMAGLSFFGNTAFSIGLAEPRDARMTVMKQKDDLKRCFKQLILSGDRLVGAVFVNQKIDPGIVLHLIRTRVNMTPFKEALFEGTRSLSDPWLNSLKFRSDLK